MLDTTQTAGGVRITDMDAPYWTKNVPASETSGESTNYPVVHRPNRKARRAASARARRSR